jgi:hypothetical protein
MSVFYVSSSDAPLKVHFIDIGCLFFSLVAGSIFAEFNKWNFTKFRVWFVFATFGIFSYDVLSSAMIVKRDFLMGWYLIYPLGIVGVLAVQWLASSLCGKLAYNNRLHRDH